MANSPVQTPASYVPEFAMAFRDDGGLGVPVGANAPLPIRTVVANAGSTPLTGSATGAMTAGPFTPDLGRPLWLTLSGTWTGSVTVLRSVDAGVTRLPLTLAGVGWGQFTGNAQEPVAEEHVAGACYFLDIAVSAGTLAYSLRQ
jgi:hypothetical protein